MRVVGWVLLVMLAMGMARANDTAMHGVSGTVTPLAGQHASIRMVSETVRMEIYPQYYDVKAEFLFHNAGKATTVTMGFPESGAGDGYALYANRTAFQSFRTTVDGEPVTVRRQRGKASDDMSYRAWWTKQVAFAVGQQRRVTVAYRAPVGNIAGGECWALYHFTGGNWAGKVASSRLHIALHFNGTYAVQSSVPLLEEQDGFSATWHDWEAEETAMISFERCGGWDLAIRGLDTPRAEDHFNWLSPRMRILHLRAPGVTTPDKSVFIPAAFVNTAEEGAAYISVRALREYFTARRPDIPAPVISWNANLKTGTFTYLGETVPFAIDPKPSSSKFPLPAIMRSYPYYGAQRDLVYVPVAEIMSEFGGRAKWNAAHELTLHFPTWDSCLVALHGKRYRVNNYDGIQLIDLATEKTAYQWPSPISSTENGLLMPTRLFTADTFLVLDFHNAGLPVFRCYDLAKSAETGRLTQVWEVASPESAPLVSPDQQAIYCIYQSGDQQRQFAVEKIAVKSGAPLWRTALSVTLPDSDLGFVAEKDGNVALYATRRLKEKLADPAEVVILDGATGNLRARYWCSLDDAVPERLPRWVAGPAETRALLNVDGLLLAGTYGQGLWRTYDGTAWARVPGTNLPTHYLSLAASRSGDDIVAGTYMEEGLALRSSREADFRLLAWPNRPRWPRWWSREYSRSMAVGYCGNTLYVQTFGGFLRWTQRKGWERTAIPANERVDAVINDSGIWTAVTNGKTHQLRHYTPTGVHDFEAPVSGGLRSIRAAGGRLYVLYEDGHIVTCVPFMRQERETRSERRILRIDQPSWNLLPANRTQTDNPCAWGQSMMVYTECGYRPAIIAGTAQGPSIAQQNADGTTSVATLDPSLSSYTDAFTAYRDTTGEWLVMGGKDGLVLLPASIISSALFAENMRK